MQRTPINPWSWSQGFGYNQGEVIEASRRHLSIAGQTAVDGDGQPQHADDMRAQMQLALANVEAVLSAADMGLENLTKLQVYTVDIDATLQNWDVIAASLGAAGVAPPVTLLGVTRLAWAELQIEITAEAAD